MKIYRDCIDTEYSFLNAAPLSGSAETRSVSLKNNRLKQLLSAYIRRYRTRKALVSMPDWQLADIGLSAEQARQESIKPFWQP
ncbi:MAG: DUF1127 domain-containing protein [Pseudomonadota bacterium]